MGLFNFRSERPFRTRSPERDSETDGKRISRLAYFLDGLLVEMENERDGLRNRYESVTTRAAFSQQALEDDRVDQQMSAAIDDMTGTMMRYTERLALLEQQIAFVTEMRERSSRFPLENKEVAASGDLAGPNRLNSAS